jgi:hypothetical protein
VEKHILALEASSDKISDNDSLEDKALELAIDEVYQANGQKWKPWASNARSMRVGDIILIVDSDTIVPEVCSCLCSQRSYIEASLPRIALGMPLVKWPNPLRLLSSSTNLVRP